MYPFLNIFGRTIGTYALCSVVGLILCGFVGSILAKEYKIKFEDIILAMVSITVGLMIGGHIVYGITNIEKIILVFKNISKLNIKEFFILMGDFFGGSVFYGGFIGACLAILVHCKFAKEINKNQLFNLFAVCVPLFHAFGRIGCFLGGCCYGKEGSWGFIVHNNTLQPAINDVRRIPVPLIESFINLLIFLLLLYFFKTKKFENKLIYIYMIIYPVARFILEFYRGDEIRGFWWKLSTSQWISIILFLFATIKLIQINIHSKKGIANE